MRAFFLLLLICFASVVPGAGQNQAIKAGDVKVSVSNSKWERGAYSLGTLDPFSSNTVRSVQGYYYQADFKNENGQKIKGIFWEYVFLDPETKQELGRHRIFSKTAIGKDDTDTVTTFKTRPPSATISANAVGEKDRKDQYIERIEIKAVALADGTIWKAPGVSDRDTNRLRNTVKRGRIFY